MTEQISVVQMTTEQAKEIVRNEILRCIQERGGYATITQILAAAEPVPRQVKRGVYEFRKLSRGALREQMFALAQKNRVRLIDRSGEDRGYIYEIVKP